MPSQSNARILLFGDSHLGAAVQAIRAADCLDRFEVWGASGSNFRDLVLDPDGISPGAAEVETEVEAVNGRGLKRLEAGMFDRMIVVGARLRMSDFVVPMATHLIRQSGALSDAVMRSCAARWSTARGVRMATHLFPTGGSIAYVPAPLTFRRYKAKFAQPKVPTEVITRLRNEADAAMRERGMPLIQQPMESVTEDMFTAHEHAAPSSKRDFTHVTPDLMHQMLDTAVENIGEQPLLQAAE